MTDYLYNGGEVMNGVKYKIPMLSANSILAFAKSKGNDIYSFNLNKIETKSVLENHGETYQDDNAVFFQLMCTLHGNDYTPSNIDIIEDLYDVIVYIDFNGIFDRKSTFGRNATKQKKAESMFRPEGINLDLGTGSHKYVAFERSASMSRNARLSFIRADLYNEVTRRITLNLTIDECELSKLYAYNGRMSGAAAVLPLPSTVPALSVGSSTIPDGMWADSALRGCATSVPPYPRPM